MVHARDCYSWAAVRLAVVAYMVVVEVRRDERRHVAAQLLALGDHTLGIIDSVNRNALLRSLTGIARLTQALAARVRASGNPELEHRRRGT